MLFEKIEVKMKKILKILPIISFIIAVLSLFICLDTYKQVSNLKEKIYNDYKGQIEIKK